MKLFVMGTIVFFVFIGVGSVMVTKATEKNVTFTVEEKTVKVDNDGDGNVKSRYLIFTDKGVYENTDSLIYFKFRSSDLYGKLKVGQTYTCKTAGFRFGLTSSYPNIINCEGM